MRLNILTRKTLGGLETNLDSQVMRPDGEPFPGLYAAGEVAGFGGGGVHGYNALEGTFLGGCIFSGRAAGRALAREPPRDATAGGCRRVVSRSAPPVGLCDRCRHQQRVPNTRGSVFSLCRRSRDEPERFPRYPRLPVLRCRGFERGY